MTQRRSFQAMAASAGVALALLAGAGVAQARDVSWSIGVGVPGVVVGASSGYYAPPAYYVPPPRPIYYTPAPPVVYAPPPPVYYRPPRPVYYAPPPVVVAPYGYYRGHGHGPRHWR